MASDPPAPEGHETWTFVVKFACAPWSSLDWQTKLIATLAVLVVLGSIGLAYWGPRISRLAGREKR